jgi:hypothetical protein
LRPQVGRSRLSVRVLRTYRRSQLMGKKKPRLARLDEIVQKPVSSCHGHDVFVGDLYHRETKRTKSHSQLTTQLLPKVSRYP